MSVTLFRPVVIVATLVRTGCQRRARFVTPATVIV
jgi:hypothetical protein